MIDVLPLPLTPKIKFFKSPNWIEKLLKFRKPLISNFLTTKKKSNIQRHDNVNKMGAALVQRFEQK